MWFSVILYFETVPQVHSTNKFFFEERIILVQALNQLDAQAIAQDWARAEEITFVNADGINVSSVFRKTGSVYDLGEMAPGHLSELHSRFMTSDEVEQISELF
jgi:hypothetical protein